MILQSYNFAANLSFAVSAPLLHSPSPTTCGVIMVAQSGSNSNKLFDDLVPNTPGSEAKPGEGVAS